MSQALPPDARAVLDAHLDAVEAALVTAGQPRTSRKAIVDDLEAQILDMLAEAVGSREPTAADVEAILQRLDPPQAYVTGQITLPRAKRRPGKPAASHDWPRALAVVFLIVCGATLVLWPSLRELMAARTNAEILMKRSDLASVSSSGVPMGDGMRFGLWLTGSAMLLGGAAAAVNWHKRCA